MPIVPDEEDLPGWVPKNYIEKGILFIAYLLTLQLWMLFNVECDEWKLDAIRL
jgi:hypothetical protein